MTLSRQEHIHLVWQAQHWKRLHEDATQRIAELQTEHRRQLQSQAEQAEQRADRAAGEHCFHRTALEAQYVQKFLHNKAVAFTEGTADPHASPDVPIDNVLPAVVGVRCYQ